MYQSCWDGSIGLNEPFLLISVHTHLDLVCFAEPGYPVAEITEHWKGRKILQFLNSKHIGFMVLEPYMGMPRLSVT